eukprot:467692_1
MREVSKLKHDSILIMDHYLKQILYQISSLCHLLIWTLIVIYHTISIFRFNRFQFTPNQRSIYGSFLLIILAFFSNLPLFTQTYDAIQSQTFCEISQYTGYASYIAFKCVLYLLLVSRLHEAFHNSTLGYNTRHLLYLSACVVVCNFTNIGLGWRYLSFSFNTHVFPNCGTDFPQWLPISLCMVDFVSSIINFYLFFKPLYTLKQTFSNTQSATELELVARKQCILSILACSTTIASMILTGLLKNMVPIVVPLDTNISIICIILMYKWNNAVFKTICCCCTAVTKPEKPNESDADPGTATTNGCTTSTNRTGSTMKNLNDVDRSCAKVICNMDVV